MPSDSIVHHLEVLCIGRLDVKACEGSNAVVEGHQHWVNGILQPGTKTQQGLEQQSSDAGNDRMMSVTEEMVWWFERKYLPKGGAL